MDALTYAYIYQPHTSTSAFDLETIGTAGPKSNSNKWRANRRLKTKIDFVSRTLEETQRTAFEITSKIQEKLRRTLTGAGWCHKCWWLRIPSTWTERLQWNTPQASVTEGPYKVMNTDGKRLSSRRRIVPLRRCHVCALYCPRIESRLRRWRKSFNLRGSV